MDAEVDPLRAPALGDVQQLLRRGLECRLALLGHLLLGMHCLVDPARCLIDAGEARAGLLDRGQHAAALVADLADVLEHAFGSVPGGVGELSDLVGDDGEAAAVLAGTGGFDRGIERQQSRLVGDGGDLVGDLGGGLGRRSEGAAPVHGLRDLRAGGAAASTVSRVPRWIVVVGVREDGEGRVDLLERRAGIGGARARASAADCSRSTSASAAAISRSRSCSAAPSPRVRAPARLAASRRSRSARASASRRSLAAATVRRRPRRWRVGLRVGGRSWRRAVR